jgi:hypothetical protein
MEQTCQLSRDGINADEIRSLMEIASVTSESSIKERGRTAMLPRDNVFHVKWPDQGERFGKQAVFA